MARYTIEIPDQFIPVLAQKASSMGMDIPTWIRQQILSQGAVPAPTIKNYYALHVQGQRGSGTINKNGPHSTSASADNLSSQEAAAIEMAKRFVQRNDPGDREQAIQILRQTFNTVFEEDTYMGFDS